MRILSFGLGCGFTLLFLTLLGLTPPQRPKVVAAHFKRVFRASKEVQAVDKWLRRENRKLAQHIEEYKRKLQKLKKKQSTVHPDSETYRKLSWQIQKLATELRQYVQFQTILKKREYTKKMKQAVEKVKQRLREYLTKRNYSLVFDLDQQTGLFYCHPEEDITFELIQALKKKHKE